jgi:hypothetical protein
MVILFVGHAAAMFPRPTQKGGVPDEIPQLHTMID